MLHSCECVFQCSYIIGVILGSSFESEFRANCCWRCLVDSDCMFTDCSNAVEVEFLARRCVNINHAMSIMSVFTSLVEQYNRQNLL